MANVQFEKDYRNLMRRFNRPPDKDTMNLLKKIDREAAHLARKDIVPSQRTSSEKKIEEAQKKVKAVIKAEIAEIKQSAKPAEVKKGERPGPPVITPAMRSLMAWLAKSERQVLDWCKKNGKPKVPVRMPTTDFAGDYARRLAKCSLKHSPAVLTALKKLDTAQQAMDVTTLYKAAKAEIDKTLPPLETEAKGPDAKSKANATNALKSLSELRQALKDYDRRVFLMSRLADR